MAIRKIRFPADDVAHTPPAGLPPSDDRDLPISDVVEGDYDYLSLLKNAIAAGFLFVIVYMLVRWATGSEAWSVRLGLIAIWIGVVVLYKKLYVNPEARRAVAMMDPLFSEKIIVYRRGFHFATAWAQRLPDEIDFQKHIDASWDTVNECRLPFFFRTNDGFGVKSFIAIFFSRGESAEALSRSLKYTLEELKKRTSAEVERRVTDCGGMNKYETLLAYKAEFANWVAHIFGDEESKSIFEQKLGVEILNAQFVSFDLDDQSKEIWTTLAKTNVITRSVKDLMKTRGMDATEAVRTAQAAQGAAKRSIVTIEGAEGAKVIAVGDAGLSIAAGGRH